MKLGVIARGHDAPPKIWQILILYLTRARLTGAPPTDRLTWHPEDKHGTIVGEGRLWMLDLAPGPS